MEKSVFTAEYEVLRTLLRDVRTASGVTQVELAARLGETQSFVSKCERGERRLDLVQLHAFCVALSYSLSTLVESYLDRVEARRRQESSSSRVPKRRPTRE